MLSSIPWSGVSVFVTERMAVIHSLKGSVFILLRKFAIIHCLRISSSIAGWYYNYLYNILAAIHFFNGIVHFSDFRIWSHIILPTHFLLAYLRTPVTVKQISHRCSCILRATRNENSQLKQLLFRRKILFKIPSCLEQLLLSNNYSLVTNTFSDQLLLEDKYFFCHSYCFGGAFSPE